VPKGDDFHLRWFTPTTEVDLCGHATLASAHVLFHERGCKNLSVTFHTKSGPLKVTRERDLLALDFPARPAGKVDVPTGLAMGLGAKPAKVLAARDYLCVFDDEDQVRALKPAFPALARLDRMVIVTSRARDCDFVSRFFAPNHGVNEDPATGSSHCTLIPYWAEKLGKNKLHARQISRRGGELFCELLKDRVKIAGHAVKFFEGANEI
jgi:predicted PhzF superfamily epimerase YddE/YHI9